MSLPVLILALYSAQMLKADTIVSNLAPGEIPGTVCCGTPPGSQGGFGSNGHALAAQFVPQSTFVLTDVELPLAVNSGISTADVFLMTDSGGLPGSVLESFTVGGLPPTTLGTIFALTSTAQPVLDAGTAYWLAVTGADSTSSVSWRRNSTGDLLTATNFAINSTSTSVAGPWQTTPAGLIGIGAPAFQIDGTVPEPSSLLLLSTGLLGLILTICSRKCLA